MKTCETCKHLIPMHSPHKSVIQQRGKSDYRCNWADRKYKAPFWVISRSQIEHPWNDRFCAAWEEKK